MTRVLFFDLGGVVFTDFFSGGEKKLAEVLNVPPSKLLDVYLKTDVPSYSKGGITDLERWKLFTDELGLPKSYADICINEYYKSYEQIKETVDLIRELALDGRFRLGILSDQPKGVTDYLRKSYEDVFNLFDQNLVVISAEVKLSKKDPELDIYKLAIERSGLSVEDIVFIDNSQNNIDNAESIGIQGFFFDFKEKTPKVLVEDLRTYVDNIDR